MDFCPCNVQAPHLRIHGLCKLSPEAAFTTMNGILRKFRTDIKRPKIVSIFGNRPRGIRGYSSARKCQPTGAKLSRNRWMSVRSFTAHLDESLLSLGNKVVLTRFVNITIILGSLRSRHGDGTLNPWTKHALYLVVSSFARANCRWKIYVGRVSTTQIIESQSNIEYKQRSRKRTRCEPFMLQ